MFAWLLVLITVGLVKYDMKLFSVIFFVDVWLFSQPHVVSTFFKRATYERFSKSKLVIMLFLLLICLCMTFYWLGIAFLFNFYFYWQWFHYFRQNYGIALSERRSFKKIETFFLHLMPVIALLVLAAKGPLGFLNYYIAFPPIPVSAEFVNRLYQICFGCWGIFQIYCYKKKAIDLNSFIYSLSAYVLYYWVYIYNQQFILGWLGMTFYHNAQYLIFNWKRKEFINTYFESKNLLMFYVFMTIVSIALYGGMKSFTGLVQSPFIPIGLICIFAVNMLHYVCDTVIWKKSVG